MPNDVTIILDLQTMVNKYGVRTDAGFKRPFMRILNNKYPALNLDAVHNPISVEIGQPKPEKLRLIVPLPRGSNLQISSIIDALYDA